MRHSRHLFYLFSSRYSTGNSYVEYKCCYGTVDSAVASDTRGSGFESSYRKLLSNNYLMLIACRKE